MISINLYPQFEEKIYILDASNICGLSINEKGKFELCNLILTILKLLQKGIKRENIIVIADANLRYKIDLPIKYDRLIKEVVIYEAPAGVQADNLILAYCLEHNNSLFISNDLMRQYYSQFPYANWITEKRVAIANIKGEIYLIPMQKGNFKSSTRKKITDVNEEDPSYERRSENVRGNASKRLEAEKISIKSTLDIFKIIESSKGEINLFPNSHKEGEKKNG